MRKTILAYILSCIEEIEDLDKLGEQIRSLEEVIEKELDKEKDDLLGVIFFYILLFDSNIMLGLETKKIYNEINYFFNEYQTGIRTNSN
jgi:hypothetical protein